MRLAPADGPRPAGAYTRRTVNRLRLKTLLLLGAYGIAGALLGNMRSYDGVSFRLWGVVTLAACLTVLHVIVPLVRRLEQGAGAEEEIGALLDGLAPEGWRVLHDLRIPSGNVDHVVLGPGGVFTVETKSNPGPVTVRRLHGKIIRQAHRERAHIARILGQPVEPLVVFSQASVDHPGRRRKGVRVLTAATLRRNLRRRRTLLTEADVQALHERLVAASAER